MASNVLKVFLKFNSFLTNSLHTSKVYYSCFLSNNTKFRSVYFNKRYFSEEKAFDEKDVYLEAPSLEDNYTYLPRSCRISGDPHNVLIIQPYLKWGPTKNMLSTPQLQLEEAVSLIQTLPSWKVLKTDTISVKSYDTKYFFGTGQLESLKELIMKDKSVSAIFLNVKSLKTHQQIFLENLFQVPVFDRYNIIINIFKEHATSKESKLMVALAEIPYLSSKVKGLHSENIHDNTDSLSKEGKLKLLSEREVKLKKLLLEVRKNRDLLRRKRKTLRIPVVAIVGYTNVGKTSLIKVLADKATLTPEDKLFATLDSTLHAGFLPRNLKVLYADTIGFITDIPTSLIEPFVATFEDTVQADVIVIVEDASHPDHKAQHEVVMSTLKKLNLKESVMKNLIHVYNKCDKVDLQNSEDEKILVSCTNGTGIDILKDKLEEAVIATTGLLKITFKVKSGGEEFSWLLKETSVYSIDVDPQNQQFCYLSVLIPSASLEIFKKKFIPP